MRTGSHVTRLLNRGLMLAILMIAAWLVLAVPTRSPTGEGAPAPVTRFPAPMPATSPQVETPDVTFLIPVAGVTRAELVDTFGAARSGGRSHNAIDIMAARGTPVLAAAGGTVEKLYFSEGGGGITVYVRSPDRRWIHYYAHLDRYAPGLAEGQEIRPGTLLGYVGSTGSASADAPHLHFAVHAMAPGERWWEGRAINPWPLLTASGSD